MFQMKTPFLRHATSAPIGKKINRSTGCMKQMPRAAAVRCAEVRPRDRQFAFEYTGPAMLEFVRVACIPCFDETEVRAHVVDVPVFLFLDSRVSPDARPQAAGAECAADVDIVATCQADVAERTNRYPAFPVAAEYECIRAGSVW